MTTSQIAFLSKPSGDDPIPAADLAYIRARGRQQAFNLIHSELKNNDISQATLARRTGKGADVISRLLKRPSNIEQDTLSELIFAITGGGVAHRIDYPTATAAHSGMVVASREPPTTTDNVVELPLGVWRKLGTPSEEAA
jgi:hypothetical protein